MTPVHRPLTIPAAAVLSAVALFGSSARAQPAQPATTAQSPQVIFSEGTAAYEAGDHATALERFQRVYVATRRPEVLFNVALALDALHRRDDARTAYQRFLDLATSSPQRAEARRRLTALDAPAAPSRSPVITPVVIVRPGPSTNPVSAPPIAAPRPARSVWPYLVLGVGVTIGLTGLSLGLVAGDPGTTPSVNNEDRYRDARDTRETMQLAGAVLGGVGVAVLTVGVLGLVLRPRSAAQEARGPVATVQPTVGGALLGVRFHAF